MDDLTTAQLVSIIGPLVFIQLLLLIIALLVCIRAKETQGPRWMWILLILFGSFIGSILFFVMGRRTS
ncbi:PLDc N-terminal domain-containing protein [Paenibacillus solisilvae]|uniref:PLDc N-terminal domain-containing protein n=1 Tax=Paenibacillus solisilvae TaxID=2486751 RepID=A0ABW0VWY7_9BACL